MVESELKKIAENHESYVTYYEDRFPENLKNTQTVPNMKTAMYFEEFFKAVIIEQLTKTSDVNFIDKVAYQFIKSKTVGYKSNSFLEFTNTSAEENDANLCLILCVQRQLVDMNITIKYGTLVNELIPGFNFNLMPGQGVIFMSDKNSMYIDKLEDTISEKNIGLSNIYIEHYCKIIEPPQLNNNIQS